MTSNPRESKRGERSERWISALKALAKERGDSEAVQSRAVALSLQLNLSPWLALAVAERLVTLEEARILDRVGRCRELQSAVLDKHRSLAELRTLLPYAAHFLAVELADAQPGRFKDARPLIRILEGVLATELKTDGEALSLRVRNRPVGEYAAAVDRIMGIMRRTRCEVAMALDVDAARMTEAYAAGYMRQKKDLEMEERRSAAPQGEDRFHFPQRRGYDDDRRAVFQRPDSPRPTPAAVRDHWPREPRSTPVRDHWPR